MAHPSRLFGQSPVGTGEPGEERGRGASLCPRLLNRGGRCRDTRRDLGPEHRRQGLCRLRFHLGRACRSVAERCRGQFREPDRDAGTGLHPGRPGQPGGHGWQHRSECPRHLGDRVLYRGRLHCCIGRAGRDIPVDRGGRCLERDRQ